MTNQPCGELVPGGLAMIVGCNSNPFNIGRIITTEKLASFGDIGPDGSTYGGPGGWLCRGDGLFVSRLGGGVEKADYCYSDPRHLMPINPCADLLEITQQQECEV